MNNNSYRVNNAKRWIKGMRDSFFSALFEIAKKDKNVILITADTGAVCHDRFKQNLSNQYINIGMAEQNMIGVASGLAMTGKIVYVYAIIPFVTMRCFEQIRVDLCYMNLPVTVVGIGAGFDYSTLGSTHHGTEDIALMRSLPGMTIYSPCDSLMAHMLARVCYKKNGPAYVRLDRTGYPLVYKNNNSINLSKGFSLLKKGKDLYIIATGRMVYRALKVAKKLSIYSINAGVIDLYKIKPFDEEMMWDAVKKVGYVVTLEEHFNKGGIGTVVSEMLSARRDIPVLKTFGIADQFCREYGSREYLQRLYQLDVDSVVKSIKKWIKK